LKKIQRKSILIIDFGSQYTQLIARRVREMGVYCEIHPFTVQLSALTHLDLCGLILSGGPSSVTEPNSPRAPDWVFEAGVPLLGICYGMQTMAIQLGGRVDAPEVHEYGYAKLVVQPNNPLFNGLLDTDAPDTLDVWMSHGDQVTALPPSFQCIAETRDAPIAGMSHVSKPWFGLQFHPEVTHTPKGVLLLKRFVLDLCHAEAKWTTNDIIEHLVAQIQAQVGSDKVILGLSGGVDSSVVAALLHRAIGDQLVSVFVDTGLLRLNETAQVKKMFADHMGIRLICVEAETIFLTALQDVSCPEEKRKIIGRTFIDVFAKEATQIPGVQWLAQGTIYPDVIESAAIPGHGGTALIKSHHNVGGLPDVVPFKLLEPLRELFKDEVRAIGLALGLPHEMVYRHPFPGPGLGVRILGVVKKEYAEILRHADAIFITALRESGLYSTVSQAFAVFLPVKSVGVMGDGRRYDYVICLRAVQTDDFMTAHWAQLPWAFLSDVSNRIINEVKGVSRVVYDISGKPPATIEWE
jgi:GMP synthase (glutamine-hydrolysing)